MHFENNNNFTSSTINRGQVLDRDRPIIGSIFGFYYRPEQVLTKHSYIPHACSADNLHKKAQSLSQDSPLAAMLAGAFS